MKILLIGISAHSVLEFTPVTRYLLRLKLALTLLCRRDRYCWMKLYHDISSCVVIHIAIYVTFYPVALLVDLSVEYEVTAFHE